MVMIYYNLVIAYSFHYLFSGFQKILPWTRCDAWWNSPQTRAECLIISSGELSDDQLDCSIGQSTNNSILFWKDNSTFQQDWIRVQHLESTVSFRVRKFMPNHLYRQNVFQEWRNFPIWTPQFYLMHQKRLSRLKNTGSVESCALRPIRLIMAKNCTHLIT